MKTPYFTFTFPYRLIIFNKNVFFTLKLALFWGTVLWIVAHAWVHVTTSTIRIQNSSITSKQKQNKKLNSAHPIPLWLQASPTLNLWQSLICFSLLCFCFSLLCFCVFFWDCSVHGMIEYVTFGHWPLSHSKISLRFI